MQKFKFDKFVKDILKREDQKKKDLQEYAESHQDSPQRQYNKLYRELPQNRIKYTHRQGKKIVKK